MSKSLHLACVLTMLMSLAWQVEAAELSLVCPCQAERVGQTAVKITAGIINTGETDSGELRIVLGSSSSLSIGAYYTRAVRYFPETLRSGESYQAGTEATVAFKLPSETSLDSLGRANLILRIEEKVDGEWSTRDRVRLGSPVTFPDPKVGGESNLYKLFLEGKPSLEIEDSEATLRIPKVVNSSLQAVTISGVTWQHNPSAEFWNQSGYLGLKEDDLSFTVKPLSSLTDIEVKGGYSGPRESEPFTHLYLQSENGVEVWETIEAREGNVISTYPFTVNSIDFLVDSDDDGVSDFNEDLFSTDPTDATSQPETVVIDVMALYTPAVAMAYNNEPVAKILHELEWGNQAFRNSNINARFRLVKAQSTKYEGLDIQVAIDAVQAQSGVFEGIDAVREEVGADLLALYIEDDPDDGTCGKAALIGEGKEGDLGLDKRSQIVSVIPAGCRTNSLSHEFGHNMGLGHDAREEASVGTFNWSRGHGVDGLFSTIMAYQIGYNYVGPGIQYFSNPEIACNGQPCGVDKSDLSLGADAALSIRTTMYQIAELTPQIEDGDLDDDGLLDKADNCPFVSSVSQLDTDGDGEGDVCDDDDDGDGVLDNADAFPLDSTETLDTDGDGVGNNADKDDDGDGVADAREVDYGTDPLRPDTDSDTLPDGWEVDNGRDPAVADYQVSSGYRHSCALDDNGVQCWGKNDYGQTDVPVLSNPVQISAGYFNTCAIDDNGVQCWGNNSWGQTDVPVLSNPVQISAGYGHTCAVGDNGVQCWGLNEDDQTDVPVLSNPVQISSSERHTCALDDNGVQCWGLNEDDQTDVPVLSNPVQISLGRRHSCALDDNGVQCWGKNDYGQTDVPVLSNPVQISAGYFNTCAIDDNGVQCWGKNDYGQTDVPVLSNPVQISSSHGHTCALDDNGVQCWGLNEDDQTDVPGLVIDPDGDGFSNQAGADAFPLDSTEQVDTDGDGIGDNSDVYPEFDIVRGYQFLQTTSASANITSLHVLNTSDREQSFRALMYDGNGDRVGGTPLIGDPVPPMGRIVLTSEDIEDLFDTEPWTGPVMLQVRGESTFDVMSKLISPSGLVSNTNCVREDRVLNIEGFDSNNMSYVRLINTSDSDTGEVIGTLYDGDGKVVGNAGTLLATNLAPYQQLWINRNDLANKVAAQWNGEALLEVNTVSGLKLLNLNYITNEETFFNFSCFEGSSSGRVYLQTTSTSQNVSLTHLVNTSDTAHALRGTLYNSEGSQVGQANQPLHQGETPAKGRAIISSEDIEEAFNISAWKGPAMLEVTSCYTYGGTFRCKPNSFELMTKLTSPSGLISNTNCVRQDQVHNIGGFDQTDVTYVRFINIGDTPITNIRGSMYDTSGNVVGAVNPVLIDELAAKAHVWLNRNQLSDLIGDTWNGTASLKINNADDNLRLLNLNFINSETFFNFSCYETGQ